MKNRTEGSSDLENDFLGGGSARVRNCVWCRRYRREQTNRSHKPKVRVANCH